MKNKLIKLLLSLSILTTNIYPHLLQNTSKIISAKKRNTSKKIKNSIYPIRNSDDINQKNEEAKKDKIYKELKAIRDKYKEMHVPWHKSFKSFMSYKKITSEGSKQYKLQLKAYTDKNGLRKIDNYYMVAMGQKYGKVGDKFRITLVNGEQFDVILGDVKKYKDTHNKEGYIGKDNKDLFEFIVDESTLNSKIAIDGSVNCIFNGRVERIQKER